MDFDAFFRLALATHKPNERSLTPYPYQQALARDDWPDLLDVPTGMGKTAGVALAWLWKRGWREGGRHRDSDPATPRRLVWCLPMRVLVEQTRDNIVGWLSNLGVYGVTGNGKVSVHVLMGGEDDLDSWAKHPEEDMILIGTQDMLLSRALMRGYGMSRYQWPIHFSLLHNDCLWVYDEMQLMGAGLATSAQLEAFRRSFILAKTSRSLWVSATLRRDWLATVDLRPLVDSWQRHTIDDADRQQAGDRLNAAKSLQVATAHLDTENSKKNAELYLETLCTEVLAHHDASAQTLVIINNVGRAQQLFKLLREKRADKADLLIHARFRPAERAAQTSRLRDEGVDRIVIATQAIEAGVDMSSKVMFTELAPWTSLIQRFGRCNRDGKHNENGARIFWINIESDKTLMLPYTSESLEAARTKLATLARASSQALPPTDEARPLTAVLRRKDFLDLFNTDPDLSGFDVDVSDYIRDSGTPGVQVFWRDFKDDPNGPELQPRPLRDELCPASIGQITAFAKRKDVVLWHWDALDGKWVKLRREPRPGMLLLACSSDGGYDATIGFDAGIKKLVASLPYAASDRDSERDYADDWRSQQNRPVLLAAHLAHVAEHADQLCVAVNEISHRDAVVRAGRWHDLGKLHAVFQRSMYRCRLPADPASPLAKSDSAGPMRHGRRFFRHELASMLGWLAQHDGEPHADLIAYLVLAHHGKVRMSLRAMPTEGEHIPADVKRFARGIHEGDVLPALDFDGEHSATTTLKLALMEMGLGEQGASWSERALRLLEQYGPFQLAWLETLVRLADWRASAAEQLEPDDGVPHNATHGLDRSHQPLAQPAVGGTAAPPLGEPATQGGAQHGLRGRAGGSGDAGSRTKTPHAATRHLDTTLGILSYAELAPHLARRVEAIQNTIREGAWDTRIIDEQLFLDLHQRICGELTPDFAGRWRKQEVVVGAHHPPLPHLVAQAMREYVLDLQARIETSPLVADDRLLESLAFAEGRLLSIHPFTDFNGRTTRVFIDWLTRRLQLPDVDPTPDAGAATDRYLAALHAADRHHWQPLMAIWRERLAQGAHP